MDDAARYAPFSVQEKEVLAASGIEAAHTEEALRYFAEQRARGERGNGAHTFDMPEIDNEQVIDMRDDVPLRMPYRQCVVALAKYIPYAQLQSLLPAVERRTTEGVVQWNNALLTEVGRALYHTCAYGMFNGGSATSYTDAIHNQNLNAQLFEQWRERIDNSARAYGQLPKGLCPALYNRDGEGAWSFMELHIRHLVRESARCGRAIPLFQMTSPSSDAHIRDATQKIYARYFSAAEACDHYALSGDMLCAVQPLLATFAYNAKGGSLFDAGWQPQEAGSTGVPRSAPPLFIDPRAEKRRAYGLPGGHGQCFGVLRTLLEALFARGVRFVWLGNVDNVGYTMNPIALAYLVLRGGEALFEAVPRSTVDRKGGVLVRDGNGQVRCMELGAEVQLAQVLDAEREGKTTLFNCAIGLFNVETLLLKMDAYIQRLPVHALHKKTVRGDYWQLEQITWDIIGLIDNPCICIGHKSERFLAAKLISESFLLSGLPTQQHTALADMGERLCTAMQKKAQEEYGIVYKEGTWRAQDM